MTLTSSLFAAVSGLDSQGDVLGIIGDNIANISTVGFKTSDVVFSSIVTGDTSSGGAGAGASSAGRLNIDQQGLIQSTGIATDIAISGQGFFVVKDDPDPGEGEFQYTRAGSFRQDERGNFVNASNFVLQAWPLDNEGRLPGEPGNLNTTSSQLLESLETVNTRSISGLAFATTSIDLGLNLDAGQSILTGAGDTLKPTSTENLAAAADDILGVTANLVRGDILDVVLGNGSETEFEYGGFARSNQITASNIFGAATITGQFQINAVAGANFLQEGHQFTITTSSLQNPVTFTFNSVSANADLGTFNSLDTLRAAIGAVPALNANIVDNRLYVAPIDARDALTFADVGTATFIAQNSFGTDADWADSTTGVSDAVSAANRFNTMSGLASLINDQQLPISASIQSAANDSSLTINADSPLETILFRNNTAVANAGNMITEFGFPSTIAAGGEGNSLNPVYDSTGTNGGNMASGDIAPAFSRNIRIFDSLGTGHDVRISFAKSGNNTWQVEVFLANPSEIISTRTDGQIAAGQVIFNGDGSLNNVSTSLSSAIQVIWSNDAVASSILLNLGTAGSPSGTVGATTIGQTDGLSQFNGPFNVQFAEQNGAGSGLLSSIEVNDEGFVIANFTNGQSRQVFKIPLASFPNPNGLTPRAGNVFAASDASGEFSLNNAGGSGVGVISVAALEGANTELADELTKLIVAQRAFQSNTRIITTADELLEELNRI